MHKDVPALVEKARRAGHSAADIASTFNIDSDRLNNGGLEEVFGLLLDEGDDSDWIHETLDDMNQTYRVIRMYKDTSVSREIVAEGLTLAEAREHCRDPETSSRKCTSAEGHRRTALFGDWFDGYEAE